MTDIIEESLEGTSSNQAPKLNSSVDHSTEDPENTALQQISEEAAEEEKPAEELAEKPAKVLEAEDFSTESEENSETEPSESDDEEREEERASCVTEPEEGMKRASSEANEEGSGEEAEPSVAEFGESPEDVPLFGEDSSEEGSLFREAEAKTDETLAEAPDEPKEDETEKKGRFHIKERFFRNNKNVSDDIPPQEEADGENQGPKEHAPWKETLNKYYRKLPFKKKIVEEPEEEPYVEIPVYSDAEKKADLEAREKLEKGVYIYKGLSDAEVENQVHMGRVNRTGENMFKSKKEIIRDHTLTYFNFLNLFLGVLIIISGQYKNITFMGVIIVNTFIGIVQELKVKKLVDKLAVITASKARVIRNGGAKDIDITEVVVKDTMVLSAGNQVCADAVVMEADGMEVNESMLTGESKPVRKVAGDRVMSGSFVTAGSGVVHVEYVGEESYAYQLMKKAKTKKRASSEMQRTINRIIKVIGVLIVPIGIMLYLSQQNAGNSFSDCLVGTVAGVIGMIPEGLVLLTSISFILGVGRLARKRALVQEMEAIEALARVNVLCLDKTGTITTGKLEVMEVIGVNGTDCARVGTIMNEMAFAFDDVNNTQEALMKYFKRTTYWRPLEKIPFSSDRKYRAIRYDQQGCFVLGAPEFLLGPDDGEIRLRVEAYANEGLRVLLLGSCDSISSVDGTVWGVKPIGLIVISDCIREEAPEIFRYFAEQNVKIKVVSGDNPATVSQIALKAGLEGAEHYVDANELPEDFEELKKVVGDYTVYGRVKPEQKQNIIRAYQANKGVVGMVGDGVNDVLALKDADCGIAMAAGSDAAKQVAHIVLLDSDFSCLRNIVSEGRTIIANIERVSSLYLTKTIYSVILCVLFILMAREYPFIPIQLSWISAVAIGIPSFILTLEQNESVNSSGFLRYVLRIALPMAINMVLCLLTVQVLTPFWGEDAALTSMFNFVVGAAVSFMVLIRVCRPMNWIRTTLTVSMIVLFTLGVVVAPGFLGVSQIFRWETVFMIPMVCMVLVFSEGLLQIVNLCYRIKDWIVLKIRKMLIKE